MRTPERLARIEAYRAERDKGKTYREIAAQFGVTYQAVYSAIGPPGYREWHPITETQCIYKGWRDWMNANNINVPRLTRMMDRTPAAETTKRIRSFMCGRVDPPKRTIDMILHLSGLTYEECFRRG